MEKHVSNFSKYMKQERSFWLGLAELTQLMTFGVSLHELSEDLHLVQRHRRRDVRSDGILGGKQLASYRHVFRAVSNTSQIE